MIVYEILAYSEAQHKVCFHEYLAAPAKGAVKNMQGQPVEFDGEDTYENALRFVMIWHPNLGKPDYYPDVKFMLVD
jgi:hypothetical protein